MISRRQKNKSRDRGREEDGDDITRLTPLATTSSRTTRSRGGGGVNSVAVAAATKKSNNGNNNEKESLCDNNNNGNEKRQTNNLQKQSPKPLCRFFVLNDSNCRYGENCAYSHDLPEGGISEARKQVPCPFFARGLCKYGDVCQLRHDDQEETAVKSCDCDDNGGGTSGTSTRSWNQSQTQSRSRNDNSAAAGGCFESSSAASRNNSTTCGICLEDVASNRYGLLSCCPHVFCFECVMEWRKQGSKEAQDRRSCPTCRKHSDYVVPSEIFAVGQEKDRIVSAYKTKLSIIPCKNFDGSLGSCLFGKDCFYAHCRISDGQDIKSQDKSMKELLERKEEIGASERMARMRRRQNNRRRIHSVDDIDFDVFNFLFLMDLYASHGIQWYSDMDDSESDDEETWDDYDYGL